MSDEIVRFGSPRMGIATDTEIFALNSRTKKPVFPRKGSQYADGLAYEFQTPVETCRDYFGQDVKNKLNEIKHETFTSVIVNPRYIIEVPDDATDEQKEVGCSPSMNSYNGIEVPKEMEGEKFRSSGGHVHIDYNIYTVYEGFAFKRYISGAGLDQFKNKNYFLDTYNRLKEGSFFKSSQSNMHSLNMGFETIQKYENVLSEDYINFIVKLYDRLVGLYSVASEIFPESAIMRRQYYGRAGSYRLKNYGIEYRVPSTNDMLIPHMRYTILQFMRCINRAMSKLVMSKNHTHNREYISAKEFTDSLYAVGSDDEVTMTINFCDTDNAVKLFERSFEIFCKHFDTYETRSDGKRMVYSLIEKMRKYSENPNEPKLGRSMMNQAHHGSGIGHLINNGVGAYESAYFGKK